MAAVVILLVGGLLVLLFRGAPDRPEQHIGAPGSPVTIAPDESGVPGRIYLISHALERRDNVIRVSGRVTALDGVSREPLFTIETLGNIDAALSPDGERLYIASFEDETSFDNLIAVSTTDGRELWRTTVEGRVSWKFGYGPSAMTMSPDGSRLYVAACDFSAPYFCEPDAAHWLVAINAATGAEVGRIDAPGCLGAPYLSPDSRTLYLVCQDGQTRIFDVDAAREVGQLGDRPLTASASSSDGHYFYGIQPIPVADRTRIDAPWVYRIYRLDMDSRRVVMQADIPIREEQPSRFLPLLAVSTDGSRLFVGVNGIGAQENPAADRLLILDAESLRSIGEIASPAPITGQSMAASNDGRSVIAIDVDTGDSPDVVRTSTVSRLSPDSEPVIVATLPNEEVLRVLTGPVPSGQQPPAPPRTASRLFVVGHDGEPGDTGVGRVAAVDAATGDELYSLDAGRGVDAALSPNATRLYVVSSRRTGDGDKLAGYVAATGEERWRVTLRGHVTPNENGGAPTIGVVQDGRVVYVLSSSDGSDRSLQWFDASNGTPLGELSGLPDCPMQIHESDIPEQLYVVCIGSGPVEVFDAQSSTSRGPIPGLSGAVVGAASSPDHQQLYVVTEYDGLYRVAVVDMVARQVIEQRDIVHLDRDPLLSLGLVALSPDGSRLFVGLGYERPGEAPFANEIWVWGTGTLESAGHLTTDPVVTGYGLVALDTQDVVAVHSSDGSSTVLRIGPDDAGTIVTRDNETIVRILASR